MRPTPLSPACGSRRGHLTPGVFNAASTSPEGPSRSAASLSPGARAGAGSVGGWGMIARTYPLPPGGSATELSKSLPRAVRHCPKTLLHLSMDFESPALSTLRPRGLNGLGFGSSEDVPLLIPPPRGISPSRLNGSKIPSPSPAFRPLPRKGQSPSRCLDDASPDRFGQRRNRPVIHFRPKRQWTRVDKLTFRRKMRGLIPCRVEPIASGAGR